MIFSLFVLFLNFVCSSELIVVWVSGCLGLLILLVFVSVVFGIGFFGVIMMNLIVVVIIK